MRTWLPYLASATALILAWSPLQAGDAAHFHPKGKEPSSHTRALQAEQRRILPLQDQRDFEESRRGFIKAPDYTQIMADAGNVAWDMGRYEFLLEGKDFDSIHPSLQRQAVLNMNYGLYEVLPGRIYQVRGFDLANITFIKGDTGWIVFGTLTSAETARAALALINETVGHRPVVAVVFSHTHADHFGGVHGVVDQADVDSGKVPVIAPGGFMEHAISENIYAGNAMARRTFFQYGMLTPASPYGHVDQAIGKNLSFGSLGLIAPTRLVVDAVEEITVDGVRMIFQNTPGTEAPAEMNTWFPDLKAFWAAENITGTIHNIYTLRGAPVRDALAWSRYINEALYEFGQEAEVMFASHNWPRWGNDRIQEVMRGQRDLYANLNNQVLHLANQGVTINQVHNVYEPPASLRQQWFARGYHGSMEHNSRAVINRYLGYWDANPTTLIPLSPADSAPLYVEMMGGAAAIMAKGRELYAQGKYRHAQEILDKLVHAQPENQEAKDLLADNLEQIGYQQESSSVRNSFLAAALELRSGIPEGIAVRTLTPDMIRAMTPQMFLDYLAIALDSRKADGRDLVINLVVPDRGERFVLELSNATLTSIEGRQVENPDLTFIADKAMLMAVMMGPGSISDAVQAGRVEAEGDLAAIETIKEALVKFDPVFELLPGTKRQE